MSDNKLFLYLVMLVMSTWGDPDLWDALIYWLMGG